MFPNAISTYIRTYICQGTRDGDATLAQGVQCKDKLRCNTYVVADPRSPNMSLDCRTPKYTRLECPSVQWRAPSRPIDMQSGRGFAASSDDFEQQQIRFPASPAARQARHESKARNRGGTARSGTPGAYRYRPRLLRAQPSLCGEAEATSGKTLKVQSHDTCLARSCKKKCDIVDALWRIPDIVRRDSRLETTSGCFRQTMSCTCRQDLPSRLGARTRIRPRLGHLWSIASRPSDASDEHETSAHW